MSISRLTFIFLFCIINFLLFTIVFAQNPAERTASISGRVTVSGNPAVNAMVKLVEVNPKIKSPRIIQSNGREMVDRLGYSTTTNADGIYMFTGLPAGDYQVSALSPVYLAEIKGQNDDRSKQITLDEGEAIEQVDIALIRGGVITGRVTDEENSPQIAREIGLTEIKENGLKAELGIRKAYADDRGVYRIYGIRPGRYIVKTGGKNDVLESGSLGKQFELTYHPNTTNADEAKVIEVKEGSEITGVDIRMVPFGKTYEASGRVIEAENGRAVVQSRVLCKLIENQELDSGTESADALTDLNGNFRLTGLRKPGRYKLELAQEMYDSSPFYTEGKYFEIDNNDVSGLELVVVRGGTIDGKVILEESKDPTIISKLEQSTISLDVRRVKGQTDMMVAWKHTRPSPDGSFQFFGLPSGNATLKIYSNSNSNSIYLLHVERDGIIQAGGMVVGPGTHLSGVRLIVAQGDGAIRGEVNVIGGTLPEGCTLTLNAEKTGSGNVKRGANVDKKGRFLIEGLLPGEYTLRINHSFRAENLSGPEPKMPQPVSQNVNVTSGNETRITITYNLGRTDQ